MNNSDTQNSTNLRFLFFNNKKKEFCRIVYLGIVIVCPLQNI